MLVELIDLKKTFPVRRESWLGPARPIRAVDGVTLGIREGENLGLVGESGSGKTTLSRLILRLIEADSGQILFEGQDLLGIPVSRLRPLRKNLQMVFQDPYTSLDPRYTVRGLLKEAVDLLGERTGGQQREEKMRDILQAVGLSAAALERFPHEFSGGERQRIAIARALIMNPRLLILDEAVSSLDVLVQEQIIALLRDLQARFPVTYLFITHNLRVVRKLCPRIAVMFRGKIVEMAPADDLFRNPLHPYTKQLLSAALDYQASPLTGELAVPENSQLVDRGDGHFVIN